MSGDEDEGQAPKRSFPTLGERRYSRTLEGGLAILGCFTPERALLGATEVAELLGMSVGTAHRLILTLAEEGYLERAASSKYRLTLRATELGMASINETGLCRHARPYLEELAQRSGYTVALGILDGPEVLLVNQVHSSRRGQRERGQDVRAGSRLPAYCTSLGKVLLAHLAADRRSSLISEMEMEKHGETTITNEPVLEAVLELVRDGGLGLNDEEWVAGACAIAAPVRDDSGDVIAAVSVLALDEAIELQELVDLCGDALETTAERISTRLGWPGAGE